MDGWTLHYLVWNEVGLEVHRAVLPELLREHGARTRPVTIGVRHPSLPVPRRRLLGDLIKQSRQSRGHQRWWSRGQFTGQQMNKRKT